MLSDIVRRIEERLEETQQTARGASLAAKLSGDAIRNLQRAAQIDGNRQGVSTNTISALAPVLRTTVAWLLDGEGDREANSRLTIPVEFYVGAGAEAHLFADGQGPFDYVNAPLGATDKTRAGKIAGGSLGPFFDSWLIFWDDVRSPVTPDLVGELCVVGLPDGRILVKKLQRSRQEGRFHLLSQFEDPILDVEVAWAALVKDMRPHR